MEKKLSKCFLLSRSCYFEVKKKFHNLLPTKKKIHSPENCSLFPQNCAPPAPFFKKSNGPSLILSLSFQARPLRYMGGYAVCI